MQKPFWRRREQDLRLYVGGTIQGSFNVMATNDLGEATNATPAISDRQIFLRTDAHLYCIAEN